TAPATAMVGQAFSYMATALNNGPSTANGVVLSSTLPAGVSFVNASAEQGSCTIASGTVNCNLGDLANGASTTTTITVTASTAQVSSFSATISSATLDNNTADNIAASAVTIGTPPPAPGANADLNVALSAPASAVQGESFTYTVTLLNNGPSTATGTVVSSTLPAGLSFGSADAGCAQAAGTVTCNLGDLASGTSTTAAITVGADVVQTVNVSAAATSGVADNNTTNNTGMASVAVIAVADLSVSLFAPSTVEVGQQFDYIATVLNNGPSIASGTTLTSTLPSELVVRSMRAGQGTCTNASGTVMCDFGDLTRGANTAATITVEAQTVQTSDISVAVSTSATDNDAANDSDTVSVSSSIPATPPPPGDGGGSGGCTLNNDAEFDVSLLGFIALSLVQFGRRRAALSPWRKKLAALGI
ncbi:MAG: DUF11 domain-containing protein, partial [Pseudomonadota bacterium]